MSTVGSDNTIQTIAAIMALCSVTLCCAVLCQSKQHDFAVNVAVGKLLLTHFADLLWYITRSEYSV